MKKVTFFPMTIGDYDEVRALWMTIRGFGIRALDDSREDIERFLRRNPATSVVARADGRIVGSILCGSDGRQGALYHVCVAKEYRRQGIGTRMVRSIEEWLAKEKEGKPTMMVYLMAAEGKESFYERFGFRRRPGEGHMGAGMTKWME